MAQGEFYVATYGPTSGPILLDGFALIVREPQMAHLLVQQIRGWSAHAFPSPLLTQSVTPSILANVDGLLVHPRQVERDLRTLSMYFFPEESLSPTERAALTDRSTRRFLTLENRWVPRIPEQAWVERAWLPENGSLREELVRVLPPTAPSMTDAFRELLREPPPRPQPETITDLRARRVRIRRDSDD